MKKVKSTTFNSNSIRGLLIWIGKEEQKRRRKIDRTKRDSVFSTKVKYINKYQWDTIAIVAIVSRQEIQQALAGPIPMEEIKRTNTVVVNPQQQTVGAKTQFIYYGCKQREKLL